MTAAPGVTLRRILGVFGVAILLLLLVAALTTYGWTRTDMGRLDYRAAVFAKVASWRTEPTAFTPENRAAINAAISSSNWGASEAAGVRWEERTIPGPDGDPLPVRIYWPDSEGPLPLYLDIHGGGWWMGDGFPFHVDTTRLAAAIEAIVVSVDYRLAPEHPYPAALDDCEAALRWMHAYAAGLNGDPERIAIGGGSAGGNLAAALAIRVRDEGGPRIAFQRLVVPATDLSESRYDGATYRQAGDRFMLKVSDVDRMIEAYVPDPETRRLSTVSPLLAEDHRALPPAFVVTAQFDPLRDQGEAYARKLDAAGVTVHSHRVEGALHSFMGSPHRLRLHREMAWRLLRAALHVDSRPDRATPR